jgi:K+-transporting ATPase KdpF subunit
MQFTWWSPSSSSGDVPCSRICWKGCEPMPDIVVGIVGVLLIGYLFVSVVRPEKF